ncbi:MAG: PilZ domain-containing protein [Humidesulfovibrio sp.]|nr:PilZ domain-containing protein [Humidesulfovibrio sp.]
MSAEELVSTPVPEPTLAPNSQVFVVLHKDPLRERIDVRATRVLQLEEDVLFLAQTNPPLTREHWGLSMEVAVLTPESAEALRPVGYVARLLSVRDDYPLLDQTVEALALSAPNPGDFFETSLRMHYRVPVAEGMGVVIRLEGLDEPELLNFSAGGARVRVPAWEPGLAGLELGQAIPFRLLFLGSGYAVGDGVVRSMEQSADGASVVFGLFFTNMEIRDIRYLERMVARTVSACRQRERDADYV